MPMRALPGATHGPTAIHHTSTSVTTHEGSRRGGGTAQDGLASEEARHEVEESTPARAVCVRGRNNGLADGGDAVAEHGTLRGGELTLSAIRADVANLKAGSGCIINGEGRPRGGAECDGGWEAGGGI